MPDHPPDETSFKPSAARFLTACLLIGILLFNGYGSAVTATFESCSCAADDGTCTANISCPGGCIALCPGGGACRAVCSKNQYEEVDFTMQVSMQQTASTSKQLASELARITGKPVVFSPFKAENTITLDVKRAELWEVLDLLSMSGKIEIGGEDFSKFQKIRSTLVNGEKLSICIHNTSIQRLVNEFASLSGLPVRVASGNPKTVVSLTAKDVTFEELLARLSEVSGTEVTLR